MSVNQRDAIRRERARFLIAKSWRERGICWNDAHMEAAIDAAIQRSDERTKQAATEAAASQGELFDTGANARATQILAAKASRLPSKRRHDQISDFVYACGPRGATRIEIADGIGVGINFVTRPVLDMIAAGRLVETSRRRATPSGCTAAVIVSPAYARGGRDVE